MSRLLIAVLTALTTACSTTPTAPSIVDVRPTIDSRTVELCDTRLTPLNTDASFYDYHIGYAESLKLLNSCACRQINARNLLCGLTKPGCALVPACAPSPFNEVLDEVAN